MSIFLEAAELIASDDYEVLYAEKFLYGMCDALFHLSDMDDTPAPGEIDYTPMLVLSHWFHPDEKENSNYYWGQNWLMCEPSTHIKWDTDAQMLRECRVMALLFMHEIYLTEG